MFDMVPWTAEEVDGSDLQEDGNPQGVSELSSPLHPEVTPGAKVAAVKHLLARPSAGEGTDSKQQFTTPVLQPPP